jgi:hypothetical protein
MTLPNFIVLGGIKCGTTSLYYYLLEHPEIFLCPKEVHYFLHGGEDLGRIRVTSLEEYKGLFDEVKNEIAIGEVAVQYLHMPIAAKNIKATIPDARLIALLRNPIKRTFSHFLMHCRIGNIKTKNGERVGSLPRPDQINEILSDPNHYYVNCSRYYKHLIRFYESFPKEKIFVSFIEDISSDDASTMKEIFRFLEVDDTFTPNTNVRYNIATDKEYNPVLMILRRNELFMRLVTRYLPKTVLNSFNRWRKRGNSENSSKKVEIPLDVSKRMRNWFYEDNLKLQDLLKRDLSKWLEI